MKFAFLTPFLGICIVALLHSPLNAETSVKLVKTPDDGIQPKVMVDPFKVTHLIYYKGDPASGNIFYRKKAPGGEFSTPLQVNSLSGSAVSKGTIRGAKFALDRNQRVHVIWNGSRETMPEGRHGPPMFYTRMNDTHTGFETQRLITGHWPVDGGGGIGVDSSNRVFVFWHSGKEGMGEGNRRVFTRISSDNGNHFDREKIISPNGTGVCGCCSMQAAIDQDDNVYVVYRTAKDGEHRDINLLLSQDGGDHFDSQIMDKWNTYACPMSSMSFGETDRHMLVGWETENQVRFAPLEKGSLGTREIRSPAEPGPTMKHPDFATSPEGTVLVVWTEGSGWNQGGNIAWRLLDPTMKPIGKTHRLDSEVPVWSFLQAYYDGHDDAFHILY